MDSLRDKVTERAVLDALEEFQQLKPGSDYSNKHRVLSLAYDGVINWIESQGPGLSGLARNVLIWITHAKRPLTTMELQHALSVKPNTSALDEKNIPDLDDMVSACAGLVRVDEESQTIHLAHNTTREYFEHTLRREWLSNAESVIARTCMTYISFDNFKDLSHEDNIVLSFPFLQYAVDYTLSHISHVVKSSKGHISLFE